MAKNDADVTSEKNFPWNYDANLHDTALGKLREKTGVESTYLKQFAAFNNGNCDPRGWFITNWVF